MITLIHEIPSRVYAVSLKLTLSSFPTLSYSREMSTLTPMPSVIASIYSLDMILGRESFLSSLSAHPSSSFAYS